MIKDTENIKKELEQLSPSLSNIEKSKDTKAPVGYFERLPDNLWIKINETNYKEKPKRRIFSLRHLGIAASIILLFGAFNFLQKDQEIQEDIPIEQFVSYLMDDIDELDEGLMLEIQIAIDGTLESDDEEFDYILNEDFRDIDDINFEPFIN